MHCHYKPNDQLQNCDFADLTRCFTKIQDAAALDAILQREWMSGKI